MKTFLYATLVALSPVAALAAGEETDEAPKPTKTAEECMKIGKVVSADGETCVDPQTDALNDDQRYKAVRELAYTGRYVTAQQVLAAMSDPEDDRVLTYMGFTHRKMGNVELGNAYYRQAIAKNPDNFLARSYMGQGFVETGNVTAAFDQLVEIRVRGGAGTWAEQSLANALKTGKGYAY